MRTRTKNGIPVLRVRKGASLREIYAAVRRDFTAADLQSYTEDQNYVPARQILAQMEEAHQKLLARQKRKKVVRNGRSSKKRS